jgi:hypothetical protein
MPLVAAPAFASDCRRRHGNNETDWRRKWNLLTGFVERRRLTTTTMMISRNAATKMRARVSIVVVMPAQRPNGPTTMCVPLAGRPTCIERLGTGSPEAGGRARARKPIRARQAGADSPMETEVGRLAGPNNDAEVERWMPDVCDVSARRPADTLSAAHLIALIGLGRFSSSWPQGRRRPGEL